MKIVLGVTGSIAAYKAAELVRLMVKREWTVQVVMTAGAEKFVAPLTFQTLSRNLVGRGLFDEPAQWSPQHTSYAQAADVLLIAPCTANVIGKIACGLGDDLLSATVLAASCPIVIAPSMNNGMWNNPVVQENVQKLQSRGIRIVDPESGELACGVSAKGRLADLNVILDAVADAEKR